MEKTTNIRLLTKKWRTVKKLAKRQKPKVSGTAMLGTLVDNAIKEEEKTK